MEGKNQKTKQDYWDALSLWEEYASPQKGGRKKEKMIRVS